MTNPKILKVLLKTNNEVNQTISENKLAEGDLNFIELIYNKYSKWYNNLFKEMFKMIKSKKVNKTKTNDSNAEILAAIKNSEISTNKKIEEINQKIDEFKCEVKERIDNLENNLNNKIDKLENKVDKIEAKFDLGFNNLKNHFGIDFLKQSKK